MMKKYLFQVDQMGKQILFLMLTLILAGCGMGKICEPAPTYYYINPHKDLNAVGRVALIELTNDSSYPQISADATEALFEAIQKKQKFGLTVIRQNDPLWRSMSHEMSTAYNFEQLSAMRDTLKSDAVIFGSVTGYRPYPHMFIALRLKLIDLSDGQLLWAIEQVWDTTDKMTQNNIKNFYDHNILPGCDSLEEKLGTVSSLKFIKFVACEAAETLQDKK
jgi:hypothetical protein